MEEYIVGIDLGGTNVRVGLARRSDIDSQCDKKPEILGHLKERIAREGPNTAIAEQICRMINEATGKAGIERENIVAIGIAAPGPLDRERGGLDHQHHMVWDIVPLVEPIREEFNVPVALENDNSAAALGIWQFEAMGREEVKDLKDFVYVGLGTGIGGGIIVNGELYRGRGNAAEIGHITIVSDPNALICSCGCPGHWEAYGSGKGLAKRTLRALEGAGGEFSALRSMVEQIEGLEGIPYVVFEAARMGDGLAERMVEETAQYNAIGFSCLLGVLDPQVIFVGGGMALGNAELVFKGIEGIPMKERVREHSVLKDIPEIVITKLGSDATLCGAFVVGLDTATEEDRS